MYTIAEDVGEDHYRDFFDTLRFLIGDGGVNRFRSKRLAYRKVLFELATATGNDSTNGVSASNRNFAK